MEETRVNIDKKIVEYGKISRISHVLNQFVLHPLLAGVSGFTLFFILAIVLDFTVNLFNPDKFLTVDIFTVLIGIAGFILAFGLSFLESTQK